MALGHALRGTPEHQHQGHRDDQLLAGVEQGQGGLALDARLAQLLQRLVVAPRLEGLVVEVLDGFVVEQRVDGLGLAGGFQLVHLAAELGAPLGHRDGEHDVEHQRHQRDPDVAHVELGAQQGEHEHHLDQGREDAVERVGDQRLHPARPALDVARHAAGLALQVEAQAQRVQVTEHLQRDRACGALGGLGEHQFAQLGEHAGGQAQQAVGHDQPQRHHQQRQRTAGPDGHRVHQLLEQQRHAHVGRLGRDHEGQCRDHAPLVLPEVGEQAAQRRPVGAGRGRAAVGGGIGSPGDGRGAHAGQS